MTLPLAAAARAYTFSRVPHLITIQPDRVRVLFPDEEEADAALRLVARVAGPRGLLLFGFEPKGFHLVVALDRADTGRLARDVAAALRHSGLSGPLAPARFDEVYDLRHMMNQVGYMHRQAAKQADDLALWRWSSAWDLLGLRQLPGFDPAAVRSHLPRLTEADVLLSIGLGLDCVELQGHLPDAPTLARVAFLAHAQTPGTTTRTGGAVRARALAVALADRFDVPLTTLAPALSSQAAGLRKLRGRTADIDLLRARRLLGFLHQVETTPHRAAWVLPKRPGDRGTVLRT